MFSSKLKFYILLSALFGIAFTIFSFFTINGQFLSIDNYINQTLTISINNPLFLISRALAFAYLPLLAAGVLLLSRFIYRKQRREAILLLTSLSGFIVAELILKPIFQIPCPQTSLGDTIANQEVFGLTHTIQRIGLMKFCYPSSHVATYVVLAGYLAYLAKKLTRKSNERLIYPGILLSIIILVGPSRLYLHVHWFSDVAGGYLLGFSLLSLIISLRHHLKM